MDKEKLKAGAVYDEGLGNFIICAKLDGELLPVGRTTNKELEIFEYYEFETIDKAKEWVSQSDRFEYSKEIEDELKKIDGIR